MATLRELVISWGFDIDDKPLAELEKSVDNLKAMFVALGAAVAGAAGTLFGLAKSTANAADHIHDTSEALGVSQLALQRLGYAAQLSGSSAEEFGDSLRFLSKAAMEAKDPASETAKTFRKLGVSALDTRGKFKSADSLFMELSDRFKAMPPGVEKTTLAMQLFGRSGAGIIQTLNNGSQGLRELGAEAEALGLVMSDEAIQAGNDFNDELDRLKAMASGLIHTLGSGLIPTLLDVMKTFRGWIMTNRELIKSRIQAFLVVLQKFLWGVWRVVRGVGKGFEWFVTTLQAYPRVLNVLIRAFQGLATVMGLIAIGRTVMLIRDGVQWIYKWAAGILVAWRNTIAMPLLIGAVVAGIVILIEDFVAFLEGRPSLLGFIIENKDKILDALVSWLDKVTTYIGEKLKLATEFLLGFFGIPKDEADAFFDAMKGVFDKLVDVVIWVGEKLYNILSVAFEGLVQLTQVLVKAFTALWKNPKQALVDFADSAKQALKGMLYSVLDIFRDINGAFLSALHIDPSIFNDTFLALENMLGSFVDAAAQAASELGQNMLTLVRDLVGTFTQLFQGDLLGAFQSFFESILRFAGNQLTTLFSFLVNVFGSIFNAAFDSISSVVKQASSFVWDNMQALWRNVSDFVVDTFKNAFTFVAGLFRSIVVDPIKGAFSSLKSLLPGFDKPIEINASQQTKPARPAAGAQAPFVPFVPHSPAPTAPLFFPPPNASVQPQPVSPFLAPFQNVTPGKTVMPAATNTSTEITNTINVSVPPGVTDPVAIAENIRQVTAEEFAKLLRPAARATQGVVAY